MTTAAVDARWTPSRRRAARVGAWLVATALLVVCARSVDWHRAAAVLASARPGWMALAVAANAAILPCMALFWRALRPAPEPPVSVGRMLEVASTATAVMNTVPFGAGHAAAVLLLVRRAHTSQRGALSVLALDQLGEGVVKVTLFLLVAALVPMPAWMRAGVVTTSLAVAVWLATLVVASKWAVELRVLHDVRRSASALLYVAATKLAEAGAIVAVQRAFGVPVTPAGTVLVLAAVILGTIVPVAPGNLGTYEASALVAYRHLGVAPETALGMAIAQHVAFILPSVGIGYGFVSARTVGLRAAES